MGVLERLQEASAPEQDLRATLAAQEERTAERGKAFRAEERKKTTVLSRLEAARRPSRREKGQQAVSSFVGGVAEMPAGIMDSIGIASEIASESGAFQFGGPGSPGTAGGKLIGRKAKEYATAIRDVAKWAVPGAEKAADSFAYSTVPQALGSGAGFIAGGAIGKALGATAKATSMGLGAMMGGSAQYHDAKMSGASDKDAWKAWGLGMLVGTSEAVGIGRILDRADKTSGGGLKRLLVDVLVEGGEEFLQEAFQTEASNIIAADLVGYDKDRKWLEGVLEGGSAGFFSGVILSVITTMAGRRNIAAPPGPRAEEPGAPGVEAGGTPEGTPEFEPVVAAAEGTSDEIKAGLREGYMGPESIVSGQRKAGFTDSGAEAARAREIGLEVFSVKGQDRTWFVYHAQGESADELAQHLAEKGYGGTTEDKLELSRLAGYSEESIEQFRTALEGEEGAPTKPPEAAKKAEKEEQAELEAQIEAEKEHRPATTAHRGELARQAKILGVPDEELEQAKKSLASAENADFALEQILEEWTAEEVEPEPEKPSTAEKVTKAIEGAKEEGRQEERRKGQRAFKGKERRKVPTETEEEGPEQIDRLEKELASLTEEQKKLDKGDVKGADEVRERRTGALAQTEKLPSPEPGKEDTARQEARKRIAEIDREMAALEGKRRRAKLPATKEKHKKAQIAIHEERGRLTADLALGLTVDEEADIDDVESSGVPYDPGEAPAAMAAGLPADPMGGGGANLGAPIGGRLIGRLAASAAPTKGKPVSAPQIIDALSKVLTAAGTASPIRYGRMGNMKARGVFHVGPEVIRVKAANNVATAAHEVGHALDKAVFGWTAGDGGPWKKKNVSRKLQAELAKMGKALYGKRKPAAGYKREGFAEFIRLYTTAPAEAKSTAPLFYRWFEDSFLVDRCPACKKPLLEVRKLADRWRDQGSKKRAQASMVEQPGLAGRFKEGVDAIRRFFTVEAWFEMAQPLNEFARQAEKGLDRELAPSEDPYFTLSALRTTHDARAEYMIGESMIDIAGNRTGPALEDIRGLVRGRYRDFSIYLWAKRAMALWTDPNGSRDPGLSLMDAQQVIEELDSPQFQLAADKVYEWNEGVLNYAAQASPSMARVVQRIRDVDPGYYIPLQREFAELDSLWAARSGGAGSESGGIVKLLRGSGRRVKNPFPVMIANARKTILLAHRRLVLDQMIRLSGVEGMGHLVVEVPRDRVPVASRSVADLIDELSKTVFEKTGKVLAAAEGEALMSSRGGKLLPVEGAKAEETDTLDLMGETLTFFAPAASPRQGEVPVIPMWDSEVGRVRWFEVDARLFKTLAGMDVYRLPKVLDLFLGLPAEIFRAGTTGLRASFGLITNPQRDVQTFALNTQSSAWAPRLFGEWLMQFGNAALHRATGGKYASPYLDAFRRLGGEMAQPLGQDIRHTDRAARRLFQGPVIRVLDPRNAFDFLRDTLQFPESAARVAELKLLAKKIGWAPGQPMTLDQSLELLLAAKQVTTDFSAAGEYGRMWNRVAPFHNAALQGPRANVRAFKRNPARFLWRGLELASITLALWWWNKDKEWYKELSSEAKALFWHVPFNWNGREELVRIPRAFEPGMMFGAMPEMFADAWYQQEPETAKRWFSQFFEVLTPNVEPVLFDEMADQWSNRDRFWDTPIVPTRDARKPLEEQYSEYTSRVARFTGELFGASPRRIDHAIRGVFGGVASDVIDAVGLGGKAGGRGDEPADIAVLGRLFQRGGAMGFHPKSIDRLYDTLDEYRLRQASDRVEETHVQGQVRLMLADATRAVSALSYIRSQTDDTDKRRALVRESVLLAKEALEQAKGGTAARERFRALRRSAEARKDALK